MNREFILFFLAFSTVLVKGGGLKAELGIAFNNITEPILNSDENLSSSAVPVAESSLAIPGLSRKPDVEEWREVGVRYAKNKPLSKFYRTQNKRCI